MLTFELMVQNQQWATAIPLLGMYPKELKRSTQKSINTCMFLIALFQIAKMIGALG